MLPKKECVRSMFDGIAGRYDLLNHLLSGNIDRLWRRRAAVLVCQSKPQTALDVAAGTADMAIALAKRGIPKVIGVDISQKMIEEGQRKLERTRLADKIYLQVADGENMPFANESFDAATMAFGIRNYENRKQGFAEIARVLRPQGRLALLEFSMPQNAVVRQIYGIYFHKIVPCIGKYVSRDSIAYSYLPQSVEDFPSPTMLCREMIDAGFAQVKAQPITFGIVHLYDAQKR